MLEHLKEKVNSDVALIRRGRFLTTTFLIEIGTAQWLVSIAEGRVASVAQGAVRDAVLVVRVAGAAGRVAEILERSTPGPAATT